VVTAADKHAEFMAAVARDRDRDAFTRLFDHFAPRVKAYLLRLRLDSLAAEEATQDVMETVWRKATLFDPQKSSVTTWIYRIARNRLIDLKRRSRDDIRADEDLMAIADRTPGSDVMLDAAQREARVRAALSALPPEQLALIRLAFFEGQSHSAIAQRVGLPLGTVKSRLRIAFVRLRRELESRGVREVE
jgi:RNA polymerase sigma-70 factor (ECF subfamily)